MKFNFNIFNAWCRPFLIKTINYHDKPKSMTYDFNINDFDNDAKNLKGDYERVFKDK